MLTVIVSTMNGIFNREYFPKGNYRVLVINQGIRLSLKDSKNFSVINTESTGLSTSRNTGLAYCNEGDIVVFTDNDVQFYNGFENIIKNQFDTYNDDIITFKVEDIDGNPFKKNYREYSFEHSSLSIMRVSSIEIAIKYKKNFVKFDTNFGLGAVTPLGEENIFLSDNIKTGKKARFIPEIICKHIDESHSGVRFSRDTFFIRKKVFSRVYGKVLGFFIFFIFNVKNYRKYFKL